MFSDYIQSSKEEILEAPAAGISQGLYEADERNDSISSREQLKDGKYETVTPATLPTYVPNNAGTSSLNVENQHGTSESTLQKTTDEAGSVVSEDEISPPLAGANVMNIIVVAIECAPWSKTGIIVFIISGGCFPSWIY